jgi:hypothetical protein
MSVDVSVLPFFRLSVRPHEKTQSQQTDFDEI